MKHYIFMGALAACMLGSCGGHEGHDHEAEGEAKGAHAAHADEIVLTPEKAQAAGVQVEEVQPAAFRSVIPTSGQVLAAQGDEATVVAAVSGVVNFTRSLIEGTQVSAGMALLTVSSQHIQEGDPVKRARIAYETAKSEYERAAKLVDKQIVSQKDFNQLKENYENARIAYEALSPSKDGKGVAVKSPIGGYVKSCLVKEGDYVTVGQPLLTVTQTRRLQLKAEVSERYYAGLKSIVSANFTTTYDDKVYRLDDLKGRLLSYGKSSGDASYYIPVTFEFDNRGDVIPGSFVEVYLLSEERQGVISLPVSAITEEQGLNFVYLQVDAECYKKQEVKLGMNDGCRVEVLSGLKGGEKVVTVGAMHVKLAAAGNTIPGHTHNH
ncbi:MAG: efflux RND transporter periplasmic adaptor subunit [Bacteroides sp.]|nr:efflux RND transporter periplasmic adaptor subunit [Bacteroides sp.]